MNVATTAEPFVRWQSSGGRPLLKATLTAIAYLAGAEIAFLIGTFSDKMFAPFWPPNIVLLCALMQSPPRDWWMYLLAVFPAHVAAEFSVGMPMPQLLVAFATNASVALLGATAIRVLMHEPPWFGAPRKALIYIAATTFAGPAVVAWGGAFVSVLGDGGFENYPAYWVQWYLANAMLSVTIGPLALMLLNGEGAIQTLTRWQKLEGAALAAALAIVCIVTLRVSADHLVGFLVPAVILVPLALVIWATIRFGAIGASSAVAIATVAAIQQTLSGPSPFIVPTSEATVTGLQMFLIMLAVPVLLLGAAIEEGRRAVQTAQSNQDLMAMSAEAADSCLWHYDQRLERFWMTENGRRMFGLDANDPLTRVSIVNSLHPDDRDGTIAAIRSASASESLGDLEFRVVRPPGDVRWIRVRGRASRQTPSSLELLSGTFTDITDRKTAEHEAAQRQSEVAHLMRVSMLGELSGGIAHELAQPLTAILSNAQAARVLIKHKDPDLKEIAEVLDDIINDDSRASEVLHRMRGLLKRGAPKYEAINVNDIIASTLQLLRSELINRRVKVSCELDPALPSIRGDRVQLQQVLLNLAMNAADASADQAASRRKITIATRLLNDGNVEVSVDDRGSGLAPEHEERIFEPFFTTKERGLGLGLSICSSIVNAHGGRLRLINNASQGVTAAFTLPRDDWAKNIQGGRCDDQAEKHRVHRG